ncbi:flagellar hook assembly protein FlgD [Novosphingobium sp.]|jgi:flagellar basal-body rod modification protein FlgD|uniref:flagellar hook assembly protein FlgD n=1 Tax=Novosphingobium sp. TaxID=1874826 RepID=UPI0035647C47
MSIASVTATTGVNGANANTTTAKGWGDMGAEDFIKLLTTQLNNQDPTEPVDNTQMLAQLAQFSNLSNTTEMKNSLQTITGQNNTLAQISAKLDTLNSTVAKLTANTPTTTA